MPLWWLRDNVRCSSWAHWKARYSGRPISVNWTFFLYMLRLKRFASENRSKIVDFAPTRSVWLKISGRRRRGPPIIFAWIVRPIITLHIFAADVFYTKKLCSRLSSSKERFYTEIVFLRFWATLRDLGATYDDHLNLIEVHVVDFPSVSWTFFARSYGWGARAIIGLKLAISLQRGSVDPKFQVEGVAPPKALTLIATILLFRKLS